MTPSTPRENAIAGVLFVLAILLGVFPYPTVLRYMEKTVETQVGELADWTREKEMQAERAELGAAELDADQRQVRAERPLAVAIEDLMVQHRAAGPPAKRELPLGWQGSAPVGR